MVKVLLNWSPFAQLTDTLEEIISIARISFLLQMRTGSSILFQIRDLHCMDV